MRVLSDFLHRYLAPFLTGVSMAGTTVVGEAPAVMLLLIAGGMFGYLSLPVGGRMIRRMVRADAES